MSTSMMRVSTETRETIMSIAREDYGGVSADEALRRLAREHWQARAVAAMEQYRAQDPEGWADYLNEAAELERADAVVTEEWNETA
jgi:phage terminase large subunit-like protein